MYAELYRYLLLHKELSLPGVGHFQLNRKPAQGDFVNRQMLAPVYSISLSQDAAQPGTGFFKWISGALSVSDREAIVQFNDFLFDLKKQIGNGDTVNWQGIGELKKGLSGEMKFTPALPYSEDAVTAEKVIREKAEHTVRVGEDEKTAAEMEEWLSEPAKVRSYWWVAPLITGILAAAFIVWHISQQGLGAAAFANTCTISPAE